MPLRLSTTIFFRRGLFLTAGLLMISMFDLQAEERDGLLFNVAKKTLDRADGTSEYTREIDRNLILKATLKNMSMKDREAGEVKFIILIKRWGVETGTLEKYEGTVDLPPLKRAEETEIKTSQFHIGGHLHGTSRMHVDEMQAWKFSVTIGGKTTEFTSASNFESLNKRSVKGS